MATSRKTVKEVKSNGCLQRQKWNVVCLCQMAIATFSVFLVVFSTMMYSMSKIKKDNPIDALKNENL